MSSSLVYEYVGGAVVASAFGNELKKLAAAPPRQFVRSTSDAMASLRASQRERNLPTGMREQLIGEGSSYLAERPGEYPRYQLTRGLGVGAGIGAAAGGAGFLFRHSAEKMGLWDKMPNLLKKTIGSRVFQFGIIPAAAAVGAFIATRGLEEGQNVPRHKSAEEVEAVIGRKIVKKHKIRSMAGRAAEMIIDVRSGAVLPGVG
ncbi:hypothetical protein LCGC14_0146830 [marine sediment metagenome]|uniref:Uncharacterized protein n=1 Tax=marine sediment metagenome TaxID=412755 RepID=A0A0F9XHL6_9ZZZZ